MESVKELLDQYSTGVRFPRDTAFEVLELLRIRTRLAALEGELGEDDSLRLGDADDALLRQAGAFNEAISGLGDLEDLRWREGVPEHHWWWQLERLG
jgi:hypothetical protein